MPRRTWKPLTPEQTKQRMKGYPCPESCAAHTRIEELFGVMTFDLIDEHRTSGAAIPVSQRMVNGRGMQAVIGQFLGHLRDALKKNALKHPVLRKSYEANPRAFMGLALGCLADLLFNLEYVRRITDNKWSYCEQAGDFRAYYPYLGVCPYCIVHAKRPIDAALGIAKTEIVNLLVAEGQGDEKAVEEEEIEVRRRYFGNKIQSHHVGRIGERVFVLLLDLITKAHNPEAVTGMVFDDQHDVDAVFFFDGLGTLAQIKASPLILLPCMVRFTKGLTVGHSEETGLPLPRPKHSFFDLATADHSIFLYFSLTDTTIELGKKNGPEWPYDSFLKLLNRDLTLDLLNNWLTIYQAFEIPKRLRTGDDIRRAWLTCGWGAPIDDNKTKAGLARSDNMMKGTYACLKYGAYYVLECQRRTLRTALIANIDPAHQYADYLEKLEDIRWGHKPDFKKVPPERAGGPEREIIDSSRITYLFDSVFTFNRQILNDPATKKAWDLERFLVRLRSGEVDKQLEKRQSGK